MNLVQAIRQRRAVRDFKPDAVSPGMAYQLISAASWAPSPMNRQPWRFTIVTDRPLLDEISVAAKAWARQHDSALVQDRHFYELLGDPHFHIFYRAPMLIVISTPVQEPWGGEACALAAENMMLAAVSLGLGTCWVGFAQSWLNTLPGLERLGLGEDQKVVAPIIVGYPKADLPPVERKTPIITWIGHHASAPDLIEVPELEVPALYGALTQP